MDPNFLKKLTDPLLESFEDALQEDPTSETPLKVLLAVDAVLRIQLDITKISKEANDNADRVLKGIAGKTIDEFLDEIQERAKRAMKSDYLEAQEDLEGYLERLKIVHRKVKKVILKPDKRKRAKTVSGNRREKIELETSKLQQLLELLRDNEIYTDDICVLIGENSKDMRRKGSYIFIEIPKIKRTILLHLGYGSASFVLYNLYERDQLFKMTKVQIQHELGAVKVPYTENDLVKWGQIMGEALKLNEIDFEPKMNMEDYDKRSFCIEELKKQYPTPEKFMELKSDEREKVKVMVNGRLKGLVALATIITGTKGSKPLTRTRNMATLGVEIYGKGHKVLEDILKDVETEDWTRERWIEELKKEYPDPKKLLELKWKEKVGFSIKGKGWVALATVITGIKGLNPTIRTRDMALLGVVMFGKENKVVAEVLQSYEEEDKRKAEFEAETADWTIERWIKEVKKDYPTPESIMKLKREEKFAIQVKGKGLGALAAVILGETGLKPAGYRKDRVKLVQAIYGDFVDKK